MEDLSWPGYAGHGLIVRQGTSWLVGRGTTSATHAVQFKVFKEKKEGVCVIIKKQNSWFEKGAHTKLSIRMGFIGRKPYGHGAP